MEVPRKRRKLAFHPPQQPVPFLWESPHNKEGKVNITTTELGDGATSRVYLGEMSGKMVAVKKLKLYLPQQAPLLIDAYKKSFYMHHPKVVQTLGICPESGWIILELCQMKFGGRTIHTLLDVMAAYSGEEFPMDLRITALADVIEGIQYLHSNDVVHGDIKPLNVLVCGDGDGELTFKVADYACYIANVSQTSHSVTLKQLMTPGYIAPELFPRQRATSGCSTPKPTKASDIYSFAILAYEVVFRCQAWDDVHITLMESVRDGQRPVIPLEADKWVSNVIKECWLGDPEARPVAAAVSNIFEEYLAHSDNDTVPDTTVITYGEATPNSLSNRTGNELDTSTYSLPDEMDFDAVHLASQGDEPSGSTHIASQGDDPAAHIASQDDEPTFGCTRIVSQGARDDPASHIACQDGEPASTSTRIACQAASRSTCIASQDNVLSNGCGETQLMSSITPDELETAKLKLNVRELKRFQIDCLAAIKRDDDVILVQPTGSGKSVCFTLPALLSPGKISLVIEPVVAIILNQVDALQHKGIDAIALGPAAGSRRSANFRRVFQSSDLPAILFCTPEYLFGIPSSASYSGTSGQFHWFLSNKDRFCIAAIDEAHKIFDRMPDYRPAFDAMKQLKELSCPIIAMSATLTDKQICALKHEYLRSNKCVVLTRGVQRDNLQISFQRYQRRRCQTVDYDSDDDDDDDNDKDASNENSSTAIANPSKWGETITKIKSMMKTQSTVLYLDFVRDVEDVTDFLRRDGVKAGKYTGQMDIKDRKHAEQNFLKGDITVLVATESYELGVDNPNIDQVIRIGCPRNLGVLLQEFGRAGRTPDTVASGLLLFNEVQDDKRLGLWLKSALKESNATIDEAKSEVVSTYIKAWRFIYSIYHGKCLARSMAKLYGGAADTDPPTCFVLNSPFCAVCSQIDEISQWSIDVQPFIFILLKMVQQVHDAGMQCVNKTLMISILLQCNENYVKSFSVLQDLLDGDSDSCWGSGVYVNDVRVSKPSWHKVIYVAVHLGLLDMTFDFRPYENHYEVHRKYLLTAAGEKFLQNPFAIMSVDPQSNVVDVMLQVVERKSYAKCHQNRGKQLKPRLIAALEGCWIEGSLERLKFIGLGGEELDDMCLYFRDCFSLSEATKKPHYLLNILQLSRSQAVVKPITVCIDGVTTELMANRAYCSGVKVCAGEGCTHTVSTKQRTNRCTQHKTAALVSTGPCNCYITYVYPQNALEDGRRWFVVLNAEQKGPLHNHDSPAEWRIAPNILREITEVAQRNMRITPKEVQNGVGMNCRPIECSLPAANIDRIRTIVKKARKEVDKTDNEKVNPFKVIVSFPYIKERIDRANECHYSEAVNQLVGTYQLDSDNAYSFQRDNQYALFQSPFQAQHWSQAEALFVDIDHTGCHYFPYLLNVVCLNTISSKYMACGRGLINHQDASSIGRVLSKLACNVKNQIKDYNIKTAHKEILVDFDDAESNAFATSFGQELLNIVRGCSVHFLRSACRVAKLVNMSSTSPGYHIFMSIARRIPDEGNKQSVNEAFDVLCGLRSYKQFAVQFPPDLRNTEVDTSRWRDIETWVDWWKRPHVLRKLSKAYSSLTNEEWDDLPGTTNPVESINRQSIPENMKAVSLKPLVEHMYLEDRRQAILQVATAANVTISYQTKSRQRTRRPAKPPEKRSSFQSITSSGSVQCVPAGRSAIGRRVSVEFYNDADCKTTTWYKGTIIAHNKKGYLITFDGCGPEENELIKSLKKAIEKGELKLL